MWRSKKSPLIFRIQKGSTKVPTETQQPLDCPVSTLLYLSHVGADIEQVKSDGKNNWSLNNLRIQNTWNFLHLRYIELLKIYIWKSLLKIVRFLQGPLNIWTEHSNCQINRRGGLKNPCSFTDTQYFLEFFYEIIFLCI